MTGSVAKEKPQVKLLSEYTASDFIVENVRLQFDIDAKVTTVTSTINFRRSLHAAKNLVLDGGVSLVLCSIRLDDKLLRENEYNVEGENLTIIDVPEHFKLSIVTELKPEENTKLEGLYKSSGNYCTQCEAEGFRHITYYLDRPDVMAPFEVTIVADEEENPVLLSNGNLMEEGKLEDGRHFARWVDPWPKPAYLFALVAGRLSSLSDSYTTKSGKKVSLNIYVVEKDLPKCGHAMKSLINSMRWDEDVYGLEYDLDIYNIVAVGDFNMGAMENKGLNVFNTKYVLADSQTATDTDYDHIQGVIGHEYFHNWTGNRVTCRDWFQLSLKEGLTVFRDQEFSSDMGSRAVKRLDDVRVLRSFQFPEDSGPLAHPVRPEKYIEINNFYTATVYNKGAEVIRMMHKIIGAESFRRGMDIYFERHDGQAVTCEDFVLAMEEASGEDLSQFRLWYSQAGTPTIKAEGHYGANSQTFTLTLKQTCPETPNQKHKLPFHIPVVVGLVGMDGVDLDAELESGGQSGPDGIMLNFRHEEQKFTIKNVPEKPALSILRGFSAPVIVDYACDKSDKLLLLAHDRDPFSRWEAGQTVAREGIFDSVDKISQGQPYSYSTDIIDAFGSIVCDKKSDPALLAEILNLPAESYLGQFMPIVNVDALHEARSALKKEIALKYFDDLMRLYQSSTDYDALYSLDEEAKARRRLKNTVLSYLVASEESAADDAVEEQFRRANNMTDKLAALSILCHGNSDFREGALAEFYKEWQGDDLVLDKWFTVQACSQRANAIDDVVALAKHRDFNVKNPNRVRSLVMAFAVNNQVRFHDRDGRGYKFLSSMIERLDKINPQVAARMVSPLGHWKKYDLQRQNYMRQELNKLAHESKFSADVYELAHRSLAK